MKTSTYAQIEQRLLKQHATEWRRLVHLFGRERTRTIAPGIYHVREFVPRDEATTGYRRLLNECQFLDLKFKDAPLPRKEAFQAVRVPRPTPECKETGDSEQAQGVCRTWYPWDTGNLDVDAQDPSPTVWTAATRVRDILSPSLDLDRLHVVVNAYLEPKHRIGPHQDKMIGVDPVRPSNIYTVTYAPDGSEWLFRVRDICRHVLPPLSDRDRDSRSDTGDKDGGDKDKDTGGSGGGGGGGTSIVRNPQTTLNDTGTIVLRPGDATIMLFDANLLYFHEIIGPRQTSSAEFQPRISVTIRSMAAAANSKSGTWFTPDRPPMPMNRARAEAWLTTARERHFERERALRQSYLDQSLNGRRKNRCAKVLVPLAVVVIVIIVVLWFMRVRVLT
jgi:hypothetical protein